MCIRDSPDVLPLPMACMGAYSPDGKRMVYAPLDGGQFEIRAQQASRNGCGGGDMAAAAAQVAHGHFTEHVVEDVVQIVARTEGIQVLLVLLFGIGDVDSVKIGIVEVTAFDTPDFVVHLLPFRDGVDVDFDLGEMERAFTGFDLSLIHI